MHRHVHFLDMCRESSTQASLGFCLCPDTARPADDSHVSFMSQIDGIWHTAVVVRGLEYFYGQGIQISRAGTTPFGVAVQVLDLG